MPLEVPRSLVEFILLGPEDDRRQLQDSPVLGDVWIEFAANPGAALELLITPYKEQAAGTVAYELSTCDDIQDAEVAYLQGIVAAKLTFDQLLRFVIPMTHWWNDRKVAAAVHRYVQAPEALEADIERILDAARKWQRQEAGTSMQDLDARKRFVVLAGLLLWAEAQRGSKAKMARTSSEAVAAILGRKLAGPVAARLRAIFPRLRVPDKSAAQPLSADTSKSGAGAALVWTVSLNRRAAPALTRSVPAVKADAARTLFTVDCSEIVWAVVDSGIDATHDAFRDKAGKTVRIRKSFDFTAIRKIVSLDNLRDDAKRGKRIDELLARNLKTPIPAARADEYLRKLALDARDRRAIDWEMVERFVEIDPATRPPSSHGTHVAGILAASKDAALRGAAQNAGADPAPGEEDEDCANGMCPDIGVYDFRVLAPTLKETEFAVIAALQYIRYINERNSYITVHGANLSLSIPHDVRNYACGQTPICNECERLVGSGVVVVAAAGNRGYQNFETKEGLYEGYAAFSVTDPGNSDGVITVGATHRYWPHTYGVSFFSSRGPTGDGRLKPDLVAPGERIRAPLPGNEWGDLDGTSMAAPHVSGAAAMLMARYSELIGQPRRIKQILCGSATDLGRERSFQGNGMLDVLRAFQSI